MANAHIVQRGDTLGGIARKNGLTLSKLLALNPSYRQNPNVISPGQTVILSSEPGANIAAFSDTQSIGVHVVNRGDTLSKIAQRYGISTSKLLSINPTLNNNPNVIYPGQPIKIVSKDANLSKVEAPKVSSPTAKWISILKFNGKTLSIYSLDSNKVIASFPARSGLPPKAPHLKELISKGRKDLRIDIDYTQSKYQNVKDAGPIPEDVYTLPLVSGMPYDKSASKGDGAGWGVGGWWLREGTLAWLDNYFGGRSEFFLHHDGGNAGTSGCIGIISGNNMRKVRNILTEAHVSGQKSVKVEVKY